MNMSVQQWRSQLVSNTNAVMSSVGKLQAALPPNALDKAALDNKAAEIAANLAQLISAARNAAFKNNGDEDSNLLAGGEKPFHLRHASHLFISKDGGRCY